MTKTKELMESLNPHQLAYVNLELPNPKNGQYMLCAFHLQAGKNLNILQAACEVAAESSTGTNFLVETETSFSREMNALVYKVEEDKEESSDESSDALDDNEDSDKDEESSSNSGSKADEIESLEQSIFDLRSSQRAVELLFEISPESTNAHEDELNSLLDESNGLLEEAQDALSQLKGE